MKNYAVDVAAGVIPLIDPRYKPTTIVLNGSEEAILSAVIFNEKDFTLLLFFLK